MANEYFQPGSVPAPNSPGSSAVMRSEFGSVGAAFDKLPIMAGHAGEIVVVNGTGTALVTSGANIGDYVTKDGVFTLTNKTMAWADNTWPGFGNAATRNAGLGAGQVLLLQNNNQLPAIDGSLLTGLTAGMVTGTVQIPQGGTGGTTVLEAQHNLGIDLKAPIFNPVFTGAPSGPTPPTGDTSSRLATTWFVTNTINAIGAVTAGSDLPLMDGTASAGNLSLFAASRQDHVHPSDTSRAPASAATAAGTSFAPAGSIAATNVQTALQELDTEKAPLASPTFTGVPQAPTVVDPSDTTDKIATTAWVQTRLVQIPVGVQLSNSNAQNLGTTPAPGVGVEASRWDHVHAFPTASQIPSLATGDVSATNVQAAITELASEKSPVWHTHVAADVTNLTAALVPFVPQGTVAATNVQSAIQEVAAEAVQKTGATGAAIIPTGNTAGRPAAVEGYFRRNSEIGQWEGYDGASWVAVGQGNAASTTFTPSGNISATNVQAAIQELDAEKVSYGYLSATNTPFTPAGNIAATNVQAAIVELDSETQAGLATKVSKSGDTMTGSLTISNTGPLINLADTDGTTFTMVSDAGAFELRQGGPGGTGVVTANTSNIILRSQTIFYGVVPVIQRINDAGAASYLGFKNQAGTLDALVGYGSPSVTSFEVSAMRAGSILSLGATSGQVNITDTASVRHQFSGTTLHSGGATIPPYGTGYYLQPGTLNLGFPSGTGFGSGFVLFGYGGGGVGSITLSSATAVSYNTASDYRLKSDPLPLTGSGQFIDALKPKTWLWKNDGSAGVGFIAHEVQEVSPSSVSGEKDAVDADGNPVMQMMEYGSAEFIANIIAELQDLRRRVAELENK